MLDPQKHIVLSKFWIGDTVYHKIYKEQALITSIEFRTDRMVPRYYCIFAEQTDGWCDEMELQMEAVTSI